MKLHTVPIRVSGHVILLSCRSQPVIQSYGIIPRFAVDSDVIHLRVRRGFHTSSVMNSPSQGTTKSTVPHVVTTNWLEKNLSQVTPVCAVLPNHFWYKVLVNAPTKNAIQYLLDLFAPKSKQQLTGKPWIETTMEAYKERLDFEKWYVTHANPHLMALRSQRKETFPDCIDSLWIPGTKALGLDTISEPDSIFPYMAPTPVLFAKSMKRLGISANDHIVIYGKDMGDVTATDSTSVYPLAAAARLTFLFKMNGFENVSVLDGSLSKWVGEKKPTESIPVAKLDPSILTEDLEVEEDSELSVSESSTSILTYEKLLKMVVDFAMTKKTTIIDVRSEIEFRGNHKQISQSCGHIPTSKHLPIDEILNGATPASPAPKDIASSHITLATSSRPLTLKSPAQLRDIFLERGVAIDDPDHTLILVSNLGISASLLKLALEMVGKTSNVLLYDGGWTEWRAHKSSPISKWA